MTDAAYLSGRLLLAMPGMGDPRFDHAVIAMVQHDAEGALGVGVGRARDGVTLHAVLKDLEIDPGDLPDAPVLDGGPVEQQRGFVLHSAEWQGRGTIEAGPFGAMTTSRDVLEAIAAGIGPQDYVVALGYAGWGAGQLDGEMRRHGWFAARGNPDILFRTSPEERWRATWKAQGIDPAHLVGQTGRA
ncbi:MAG: YqgE/AlgH family protein [Sphingomonadales bacterium]|nr:YqgE/AlgH family protein [Sphingomonadales bacterium]